ncbi:MAG: hypothetical protein Q9M91_05730 [Candidatus Dojkabacteria bacterium]|nr:hypothetical protein [Candidatus Dojkabacteria bacterium]
MAKCIKEYVSKVRDSRSDKDKTEIKENDDTLNLIEKKSGKSGFYTDIRLVVVSQTSIEAEAHLTNLLSSFDQYTKEG